MSEYSVLGREFTRKLSFLLSTFPPFNMFGAQLQIFFNMIQTNTRRFILV